MKALYIEITEKSPKVILDPEKSIFLLNGESRAENVREFYGPVLNWLNEFEINLNEGKIKLKDNKLEFSFILDYFNSSSAKYIMSIITKLHDIRLQNKAISVDILWHHEKSDEDMLEAGIEFQNITKIPFKFVIIK